MGNFNAISSFGVKDVTVTDFKAKLDAAVAAGALGATFVAAMKVYVDAAVANCPTTANVALVLSGILQVEGLRARYELLTEYN